MEFFKETSIDFMGIRRYAMIFSVVILLASIVALVHYGLHLGLDFSGGTQYQIKYSAEAPLETLRKKVNDQGIIQVSAVRYGVDEVLLRIGSANKLSQQALAKKIKTALPAAKILRVEFIGPQVGKELTTNGLLALLVALIGTTIYIAFRFEYRFAVSSAIALIHDPILILGIFAFFQIEFNLTTLAAVLTVIGYSLNDTIVVFDRVRENFKKMRKATPSEIVNLSVNQTLSRTIMTSGLTLLAVLALYFFGGPTVHGFALALTVGIVIGTYSSIYVAGALAVDMGLNRKDFIPQPKKEVDALP